MKWEPEDFIMLTFAVAIASLPISLAVYLIIRAFITC